MSGSSSREETFDRACNCGFFYEFFLGFCVDVPYSEVIEYLSSQDHANGLLDTESTSVDGFRCQKGNCKYFCCQKHNEEDVYDNAHYCVTFVLVDE